MKQNRNLNRNLELNPISEVKLEGKIPSVKKTGLKLSGIDGHKMKFVIKKQILLILLTPICGVSVLGRTTFSDLTNPYGFTAPNGDYTNICIKNIILVLKYKKEVHLKLILIRT